MSEDLDIPSLSELPSVEVISFEGHDHYKVILPVYCLSFFRSLSWKSSGPAFLVFTDFTMVRDAAINYGDLVSPNVPRDYYVEDGTKIFDRAKLFSTSVPAFKFTSVCQELKRTNGPLGAGHDFNDKYRCQFEDQGIFARVTISLKVYRGKVESNFTSITVLNNDNVDKVYAPSDYVERNKFINLLQRFKKTASSHIFTKACKNISINELISNHNKRSDQSISQPNERSQEPPAKVQKKPNGMSLFYQQHVSTDDTQKPISHSQIYSSQRSIGLQSQIPQAHNKIGSSGSMGHIPNENTNSTASQCSSEFPSFDEFLINKVTIKQLLDSSPRIEDIKKEKIFEIDAYIKGLLPYMPFIIKPFKRTLKVANFKLILIDNSTDKELMIEFNSEEEICKFLQIDEVEEIFNHFADIENSITKLVHNPNTLYKNLKIKRCLTRVNNSFLRPHWTCLNPLSDLMRTIRN